MSRPIAFIAGASQGIGAGIAGEMSKAGYDGCASGSIAGTYLHGVFDSADFRGSLISAICARKGIAAPSTALDYTAYKETQYDKLASAIRANIDMEFIYKIMRL